MRRLTLSRRSLSSKLLAAALPLVVAIGVLSYFTIRNDLQSIAESERATEVGNIYQAVNAVHDAISAEQTVAVNALLGRIELDATADPDAPDALEELRPATDAALAELTTIVDAEPELASDRYPLATAAVSVARKNARRSATTSEMTALSNPFDAYELVYDELRTITGRLQAKSVDAESASAFYGANLLLNARIDGAAALEPIVESVNQPDALEPLLRADAELADMLDRVNQFETAANAETAQALRNAGIRPRISGAQQYVATALDRLASDVSAGPSVGIDPAAADEIAEASRLVADVQSTEIATAVDVAMSAADSTRNSIYVRMVTLGLIVAFALLFAWMMARTITRRIRRVAESTHQVTQEQLPALVRAISDPKAAGLPEVASVKARGSDEIAMLAGSFNELQTTLASVATEQAEVLRRGVSDIFVTMARRNRSLVDRQLALLDQFEASEDDPQVLSNYYQLDHLSTRMRRNSESLLVLANSESQQRRIKATEIDTVVRASVGEVEDYQRIDIRHLDPAELKGPVVADLAHLIAELLDNATSFSPPETAVEVAGSSGTAAYTLRIVDRGIGMSEQRLDELNDLLQHPPVVGLSVEPTLGMSVVSLLAHKHGISVHLQPTAPGITVHVTVPSSLFTGLGDEPEPLPVTQQSTPQRADSEMPEPPAITTVDEIDRSPSAPQLTESSAAVIEPPIAEPTDEVAAPIHTTVAAMPPSAPFAPPPPEPGTSDIRFSIPDPSAPTHAPAERPRPVAPPMTATGPTAQPVTPSEATPGPQLQGSLPTRDPGGSAVDGGPDRMGTAPISPDPRVPNVDESEDDAVRAALDALEPQPLEAATAPTLPSRHAGYRGPSEPRIEEPSSATKSRLDPAALRDRLRAFQNEFDNGLIVTDTEHGAES